MSRKFLTLMTSQLLTSYLEANIAKKKINLSSIVIIYVKLHHSWRKTWNFVFHFNGKNTFTVRSRVHVSCNTRVECERWSRLIKKTLARRKSIVVVHLLGLNKLYTLFECFYGRFQKASKCPVWYSMLISSHIHNAANRAIAKNSWQSYFKKFEVFFSRKQQGAIRTDWKIYSYIFYHLCIMVTIFQVATSLSIFSTMIPSLAQYRKQMKTIFLC